MHCAQRLFKQSLFALLVLLNTQSLWANDSDSCSDGFSDAIASHDSGGTITLGTGTNIIGNPDAILDASSVSAEATACGGNPCTSSTTPKTAFILPAFQYQSGGSNVTYADNATYSFDGTVQDHGNIITYGSGTFSFAESATGVYRIQTLQTGYNGGVEFAPGDYYIETVNWGGANTISITGTGTVRLFIQNTLTLQSTTYVNTPTLGTGDPGKLVLVGYNNFDFSNSIAVTAYTYAAGNIVLNSADYYGSILAANVTVYNNVNFNYIDPVTSLPDFGGLCHFAEKDPIAQFSFDEIVSSVYPDDSGNGYTGTPSASSVIESSGKVCSAVQTPWDTTTSFVGVQTDIDSNTITQKGSLALWVKMDTDWNSASDRKTILYAKKAPRVFGIEIDKLGNLQFEFKDSSNNTFTAESPTTNFLAGDWHHIVYTWDLTSSIDVQFYIDGALVTTNVAASSEPWANFTSVSTYDEIYLFDRRAGDANPKFTLDGLADELYLYNYQISPNQVTSLYSDSRAPCPTPASTSVDHFDFSFSATGSTCPGFPSAITIVAMDASNAPITDYTGNIDITTSSNHGTWSISDADGALTDSTIDDGMASYQFVASDLGEIVLNLENTHADNQTINAEDSANSIDTDSTAISFDDNVFLVEPDNIQVAGKPLTVNVSLILTDASNNQCGIATDFNETNIKAWYEPSATLASAKEPKLNNQKLKNTEPNSSNETFNFVNGVASVDLTSTDIGDFIFHVFDDLSGYAKDTGNTAINVSGESPQIILRPFALAMDFDNDTDSANSSANNAFGSIFKKVDETFTLTVTPVLWDTADDANNDGVADTNADLSDNTTVPNFDLTGEAIEITTTHLLPAGGASGALSGITLSSDYSTGSRDYDLSYSEVGTISLSATVFDGNYLTTGNDLQNTLTNVGRFTPDHFSVSLNSVNLQNALTACSLTYQGQDFNFDSSLNFTMSAHNASGGLLLNYAGDFNKFDTSGFSPSVSRTPATNMYASDPSISWQAAVLSDHTNFDGDWLVSLSANSLQYPKLNNLPLNSDIPFSAEVNVALTQAMLTDLDGICTDSGSGCTGFTSADISGATVVYGVAFLQNQFQSEILKAHIPVQLKIWAVQNSLIDFYTLTADSCSTFDLTDFEFLSCNEVSGSWCNASYQSTLNAPHIWSDINTGVGELTIENPGENNSGRIQLRLNVPSYLQFDYSGLGLESPKATLDFGINNTNESLIYIKDEYR